MEMEVTGQLHALAILLLGKGLQYPLYRRLGEPQSWSRCFGDEKNLLPLPVIEPQPISIPTALFQLLR
jgi:hypothetical protein